MKDLVRYDRVGFPHYLMIAMLAPSEGVKVLLLDRSDMYLLILARRNWRMAVHLHHICVVLVEPMSCRCYKKNLLDVSLFTIRTSVPGFCM